MVTDGQVARARQVVLLTACFEMLHRNHGFWPGEVLRYQETRVFTQTVIPTNEWRNTNAKL